MRLSAETSLTEKLPRFQDPNDRFLALVGGDRDLHPPILDVEDRIGARPLDKDVGIFLIIGGGSPDADLRQELAGIAFDKPDRLRWFLHCAFLGKGGSAKLSVTDESRESGAVIQPICTVPLRKDGQFCTFPPCRLWQIGC